MEGGDLDSLYEEGGGENFSMGYKIPEKEQGVSF